MSSSKDPSSTPLRLSLYSFPTHLPVNPGIATPPLRLPVSIPYEWEEAPGKPKTESRSGPRKSGPISVLGEAAQRLRLPPRLLSSAVADSAKSKATFSSTGAMADGNSRALGPSYSFSFAEGRTVKKERGVWPWSKASSVRKMSSHDQEGFRADSFDRNGSSDRYSYFTCDASSYNSYSFRLSQRHGNHDVGIAMENNENSVRISGTRSRSHASVTTSRLWVNIYNNLKQVVSWRREKISI